MPSGPRLSALVTVPVLLVLAALSSCAPVCLVERAARVRLGAVVGAPRASSSARVMSAPGRSLPWTARVPWSNVLSVGGIVARRSRASAPASRRGQDKGPDSRGGIRASSPSGEPVALQFAQQTAHLMYAAVGTPVPPTPSVLVG
jgi:hypothetical protein